MNPEQKRIYIAIVSYDQRIEASVWNAIMNEVGLLADAGYATTVQQRTGDADLGRARNAMFAAAYEGMYDELIFIDSDVSWSQGSILRLLKRPVEMVAGIYPHRVEGGTFPILWLLDPEGKGLWAVDPQTGEPSEDGLIEVEGVPAGFLRISRAAMAKLAMYYGDSWYYDNSVATGKAWSLFEFVVRDQIRTSEDLEFCRKWREIGGKIWIEPFMELNHHGLKTYQGNIGKWLRSRPKEEPVEVGPLQAAA